MVCVQQAGTEDPSAGLKMAKLNSEQLYLVDAKKNRKLTRLGIMTRLNRQTEHTAKYEGTTQRRARKILCVRCAATSPQMDRDAQNGSAVCVNKSSWWWCKVLPY